MSLKTCSFLMVFCWLSGIYADPVVKTSNGYVRGKFLQTHINTSYYAFWNMPYGKPPIGKLRFQAPQPTEPWSGVRDATKEGNSCVYMNYFSYYPEPGPQDEDCLYVNVYTPTLNSSVKLPVMFWIYGGGFRAGSGIFKFYGPQNFMDENVILVTFNYRLGPLGFLSTGDNIISGNAGLKDQLLALKWVQNNIENFGGDPDKVTIFGESAGGMAVGLHLVSKKSKGLFRGAICMSGCTLSTTLCENPKAFIYNYTNLINPNISKSNSTNEINEFLLTVPVNTLMSYALQVNQHYFIPVLELQSEEAFISNLLYDIVATENFNGESLLIGTTSEESLTFISEKQLTTTAISYDQNSLQLLPTQIVLKSQSESLNSAEFIKNIYLNDSEMFENNLAVFLKYYSDNIFVRASYKQSELQSQYQPIYVYRFSFYGTISRVRNYVVEGAGKVGHFSELPYLFNMTQYPLETNEDDLIRKKFTKLWANFAKYLNPTPEEFKSELDNIVLPRSTPENLYLLDINTNLTVEINPESKIMSKWNEFWEKYVQKPYLTF
ncbi:juvenile hormone esterase-like [Anthonomus grandis grandis]|uniref:juvenile hormone esterase-like n=1 Tax=Anthonomus grandis grandis TaxID=2921223 RepID=UPI0021669308|nr:juvenile hormone esterase-like [Anthonomus grandis grandis]